MRFELRVPRLQDIIAKEGIEKKFKLSTTFSCNNYVMFNPRGQIQRYHNEEEILQEFFALRKILYERRKEFILARLRKECEIL